MVGREGRRTSFEVTTNSMVVYSKLATRRFPDSRAVAAMVAAVVAGADPARVTKQESGCCIL